MNKHSILIWDLPTRIFHWVLFVCVVVAFITGVIGGNLIEWHGYFGLAVTALLVFRLVWGVIGSTYARFIEFIPSPGGIIAYLRGQWHGYGHNPVGALSVLALLSVLSFQAVTGLFSNDDIAFEGPLYKLISGDMSNVLTVWHRKNMWIIGTLVTLHVLAIVFYAVVKKDNMVKPMITGYKEVSENEKGKSAKKAGLLAFIIALIITIGIMWIANGGLIPPPEPVPAEALPAW